MKRSVFVETLAPINTLDAFINVLGPYTVKEYVDRELMTTLGDEIYPAEPRPWTVEAKCVELTYDEDPRPWTVEAKCVELTY